MSRVFVLIAAHVLFIYLVSRVSFAIAGCHWGMLIYILMMPVLCSQWYMISLYRTKLRRKFGLVEAPYTDVVSHIFCPLCSLCQEFRELKIRGLDPALGTWHAQQSKPSLFIYFFSSANYSFLFIPTK